MGYAEIIALEAKKLPAEKQAEVLDFIVFLKARRRTVDAASVPKSSRVPTRTLSDLSTI